MNAAGQISTGWAAANRRLGRVPAWLLALPVIVLAWGPGFAFPAAGLDVSWWSGLYMAAHDQLQYGREIVFTYGPLGFLKIPWLFYSDLAALAYLYSSAVFVGFAVALVSVLRRVTGPVLAPVAALLVLALVPGIEMALAIAVLVAFRVLAARPGDGTLYLYAGAGGAFAAAETLMKLSIGPQLLLVLAIGLIACRPRRGHLAAFAGTFLAAFLALWVAAGQELGALPDFGLNSLRMTAGYNDAMATEAGQWWKVSLLFAAAAITVAWAWLGAYPGRRERAGGTAIALLVAFAAYKQGAVRADAAHAAIFATTIAVLWLAVPTVAGRNPVKFLASAGLFASAVLVLASPHPGLDLPQRVERFVDGGRMLVDSGERDRAVEGSKTRVAFGYEILPRVAFGMHGQSIAVEPWETMVAWAYGVDWDPAPVFQNYSAYTSSLDEMNADAVASPDGASAVLRRASTPTEGGRSIDGRLQAWDPPAQAVATLCHFEPAATAGGWQLLGRVPDRCGEPVPAGTVRAGAGEAVPVPEPAGDEVILAKIDGAQPSLLRRIAALFYRPALVYVRADDGAAYRLIPATAGDGLMLRSGREVREDRGRFSPIPQTRTIAVEGAGDDIEFRFFRMKVR